MALKKTAYYIFIILVFFSVVKIASAEVVINEIQISPTEGRFIELYNSGDSTVNLTNWYIQRKIASGSDFGSLVSKTYFEGKSIDARGYLLISRNNLASLTLTESNVIQLKNSNQDLISKVGWGNVSDCGGVCAPNPTQGKSIQRSSGGNWIISSPTPGYSNSESVSINITDENTNTDSTDASPIQEKEPITFILKTTAKIISPKVVVAGIPFSISSQTTTNKGETFNVGKFIWNFGDGMASKVGNSEQFEYIYEYPGEYVLTLSYFDNSFSKIPTATDRITMKVIPSDVYVSSVGNNADPFIEIGNKSSYEIILSNWVVTAGSHYFIIPEGTTLLPGKKIKLAPKITGFVGEDLNFININNPSGEIIATYPVQTKKIVQNRVLSTSSSTAYSNSIPLDNPQDVPLPEDSQVINLNDLGSSDIGSEVNTPNSAAYPFVGLGVVVMIGVMSFLLIRKKKGVKDYVEEGLSAKDMTIIE